MDEKRAPLKTPAWEANSTAGLTFSRIFFKGKDTGACA